MSDPQSKRPRLASATCSCPEPEFLLAFVPVSSCTVPPRHGKITHQPEDVPYGGIHYHRTGHRGLKPMNEEPGGSQLPHRLRVPRCCTHTATLLTCPRLRPTCWPSHRHHIVHVLHPATQCRTLLRLLVLLERIISGTNATML